MKTTRLFVASLAGAAFAAALILACSDDSPGDADAAVCDCPAAEPPLEGRITSVPAPVTVPAGSQGGNSASCPAGGKLLGGGCRNLSGDPRAVLIDSGPRRNVPTDEVFFCRWVSTSPDVQNVQAEAICLVPAP